MFTFHFRHVSSHLLVSLVYSTVQCTVSYDGTVLTVINSDITLRWLGIIFMLLFGL